LRPAEDLAGDRRRLELELEELAGALEAIAGDAGAAAGDRELELEASGLGSVGPGGGRFRESRSSAFAS